MTPPPPPRFLCLSDMSYLAAVIFFKSEGGKISILGANVLKSACV